MDEHPPFCNHCLSSGLYELFLVWNTWKFQMRQIELDGKVFIEPVKPFSKELTVSLDFLLKDIELQRIPEELHSANSPQFRQIFW